jgi:formylglycine-generating enzyme required for sulfatase activity
LQTGSVDLTNLDLDGDGHYKPSSTNTPHDDCNDNNPSVYPGAWELCDALDNNCSGGTDEQCAPLNMARIPAGCFNMGDSNDSCGFDPNECPVHNVCITSIFYMDKREVTNAEYAVCVSGGGCTAPLNSNSRTRGSYYGNPTYNNFPVIWVNWNQANAYCMWLGKRLPTEAEWEYAARGGLSGKRYPWGDTATACVDGNFNACIGDTSEAESYPANGFGLYDVGGNVWEWVNDWYLSTYYTGRPNPDNDPPGPPTGTDRVARGGSWGSISNQRVAFRGYVIPSGQGDSVGFRCVGD